jgi:hypothetical protein
MFGLLVLVGLFVALTPGVLFRLKGSKKGSAAMHAVLFGVVVYVVSMYGPSYGVSIEGFQSSMPACQGTSSFLNGSCVATTPAMCTSGTLGSGGKCLQNGKIVGMPVCPPNMQKQGGVCVATVPAVCPGGTKLTKDGMCQPIQPSSSGPAMAAPALASGMNVFCGGNINKVFRVGITYPDKQTGKMRMKVFDATGKDQNAAQMDMDQCSAISTYFGKDVYCNGNNNLTLTVKNVRPDAAMEVFSKKTPYNVQAMPPGACVLKPTVVGAVASVVTGKPA